MQQHSLGRQQAFQVLEYRETSTIVLLRDALAKCSDEALKPETTGLSFIGDVDLHQSIRRDISAANQDLVIGEWRVPLSLLALRPKPCCCNIKLNSGYWAPAIQALLTAGTLPQKPK